MAPPAALQVVRWTDDQSPHDVRSQYAEQFWLPTLGPTALLLLRNLARQFETHPSGFTLEIGQTSAELGLGVRLGNASPLRKALVRLAQFQLAAFDGCKTVAVKDKLPDVSERHLRRLPVTAQRRLAVWNLDRGAAPFERVAKAALAHALADPTISVVERRLFNEGHHPSLCFAAARWACETVSHIPPPE